MSLKIQLEPQHQPTTLVDDTLLNIFWHLAPLKRTLRSTGLVCQAWYNPAMDVLWANSINLQNLLNVLSPLEKKGRYPQQHFTQPLTPQSWSRFHSLAHRVRDASMLNNTLDPTLVSELSRTNPKPGPLLPNVRRLFLREDRIQHLLIWMGPTVETLNLFLKTQGSATWRIPEADDPQKISDFFTRMVMLCPNLTDLTLGGQGIGVESIAVATQSIKQLRGLQSVYLSNNDDRDVTAILLGMSELPALESLTLDCLVNFPSQWPHSTTPFPKLKKVFVKWPSHSGTETFLRTLVSTESPLTDLALGEESTGYILDLKGMMILVGEHERLESLVMHSRQDKGRLNITTLTPILRCRILSTLILDHEGDVELTDDDIETLASNLTQLVHLTLPSCNTEPTSPLTLRAISIVVSLCPDLETLWIEVDAREVIPQEQHAHVAPHKCLRQLNLGVSLGSREVNDMAYFIAGLSDVEDFRIAYDLNGMLKWRWAAVNAALPAMRMKRKADMG